MGLTKAAKVKADPDKLAKKRARDRKNTKAHKRERQRGSDADADKAGKRFQTRLNNIRAGRVAPPAEWQRPGSRLAEVLGL